MMKRIGIMGGTFNPIHNGHLAIAERAREQFALEKVLFMPSGIPYMKDQHEVLPARIRCEMTALAIADNPYFELSTLETADAGQGKNTYTCETLQKLHRADPDAKYFFILGADSLYAIENWKNPALIFQYCTILAAVRTTEPPADKRSQHPLDSGIGKRPEDTETPACMQNRLLRQIRYLHEKYSACIEILQFAGMDVSSTQIREKVRHGESVSGLIPKAVEQYILVNACYQ